ncbi:MAG: sarcosine oxidase subunit delta [Planctomycetota bacterium]|nr:sarcosine oxidase subunit delta [Planctomycetota bacterium]
MSFLIPCPNCGKRSVYEFRFGSEYKKRPSPNQPQEAWTEYSYMKRNEAGLQKEWWFHRAGCRQWFLAVRDTVTNEVHETLFPRDESPRSNTPSPQPSPSRDAPA